MADKNKRMLQKQQIIKILEDWNFWKKDQKTGIKRKVYIQKLEKFLNSNQILVIMGPRRSGKSFIMRQLGKELINKGQDKNSVLIVNLEDPRFDELDTRLLEYIYETYLEFLQPKGKPYIFLDEIQEVEQWEKWVSAMKELDKANIVVSGSNAHLLSRELSTLLTGRHLDVVVSPLSFKEFLNFQNIQIKDSLDIIKNEISIKAALRNYIEFGGFPEVTLRDNKNELILTYFNDLIQKDIIKRYKVRKTVQIKELLKFYLTNISSLITYSSIEKFLGISADTIEKFSSYFENTYLVFFIKRFSFKVKEQEKSPRKVYAVDTGLANTVGFRFSENLGRLAENVVFLELFRKKMNNSAMEIYYWKDAQHREVDFVVKEKMKIKKLIQVCWRIDDPKTKKREVTSLLKGMEDLGQKKSLIITSEFEGQERFKDKYIEYVPLWKWLLL